MPFSYENRSKKGNEAAWRYCLGTLMYQPFTLRLHPFEWGPWRGFDRLSLNGSCGTHGLSRCRLHHQRGTLSPSNPPAFALSLSKGCAGFDPPVLGTVEGLSPNGM